MASTVTTTLHRIIRVGLYLLVSLVPADDRLWVFTSHGGTSFAENAKYQFLYSSGTDDVRAVWISSDDSIVRMLREDGYEAHSYHSIRGKYLMLRSGYAFITHAPVFHPYSGNATRIQLAHGNMLKRMGFDKKSGSISLKSIYRRLFGLPWDYFTVTSSSTPAEHARSAYDLSDEAVLVTGYPRTDVILGDVPDATVGIDQSVAELFRGADEHRDETLICIFPTWNGGRTEETRFSSSHLDLEALNDVLAEHDARLVVKQHPYATNVIDDEGFDRIDVVSKSVDMYPFLADVDVLITDYSSIYFDYLLVDDPLVFYPYDLEQYTSNRGLYFEYDSVTPGPKASDPEELTRLVERTLDGADDYADRRATVRDEFFEFQDGNACERIHQFALDGA